MTARPIIGLVSQKGGVGKSTLARALASIVAHAGHNVRVADLDARQETSLAWSKLRLEERRSAIVVEPFDRASDAIASAKHDELLIIDTPSGANRGSLEIAHAASLIVQPTSGSLDDLRPAVLLFHELVAAGVPHDRLVFALCRILSQSEEDAARQYIAAAGYDVLPGAIPERGAFRDAHNRGQAINEAARTSTTERIDQLFENLLQRISRHRSRAQAERRATRTRTQP